MPALGAGISENASVATETDFGRNAIDQGWNRNVLRVIKSLWVKPAAGLKTATGLSLRQCENIVAEKSGMSIGTLRLLLRTDFGFDILSAYVTEPGEPDPDWLTECRYHHQSLRLTAEIAEARARLKEAKKLRKRT